jgi:hypothetical protein
MKIHTRFVLSKHAIVKLMLALLLPAPVFAFQIKNETGEVIGSFDTTVSLGSSWRAQKRDPVLVGISNGGSARSNNEDDGNLNFNKHKNYSNLLKVTHELGLKHQNYGLFTRGTYFYDFAYSDRPVSAVAGYGARGRDRVGSNGELLDLFVYGSFDLGGRKLNARLGQQVVSWGEGTFIPNGINVINPVDLARLRAPGSELKEAFVPQPMVWASHQLTDRLSVEAFYQIKHRRLVLDPRGTYFSTNDFISDDGDRAFVGFGRRVDQHAAPGFFTLGGGRLGTAVSRRGETPVVLRDLPFGSYVITVSRAGYLDAVRGVDVLPSQPVASISVDLERQAGAPGVAPAPAPAPAPVATGPAPAPPAAADATGVGSLYVVSSPADGRLFIDGQPFGTAPAVVPGLRAGRHVVRVEMPGHRTFERTVDVPAGQRVRVDATLVQEPR